jgi:hypothetical protein
MIVSLTAKKEAKQQPIKPQRPKENIDIPCKTNQNQILLHQPYTTSTITKQPSTLRVRLAFNAQPFHTQQIRRMTAHQTPVD